MRLSDLLSLPISALWQQKARTLLTTLGVIFGSFVLAASLSIGQGVQDTIARESGRRETLRMINVYPEWQPDEDTLAKADVKVAGQMSDARRERIRHALAEYQARFSAEGPRATLTPNKLGSLARLAHVESVIPVVNLYGYAVYKNESGPANAASVRVEGEHLASRLLAGRSLASPSEKAALVSEFLLYRLGVVDDKHIPNVVGRKIRLEFRDYTNPAGIQVYLAKPDGGEVTRDEAAAIEKIQTRLPEALEALELSEQEAALLRAAVKPSKSSTPQQRVQAVEYEIAGVVRLRTPEERAQPWDPMQTDADVALPYQTAAELLLSMPGRSKLGFDQAVVIVDREEHVEEVFQAATDMGLRAHAVLEFIKQQQLMYLLIFGGMTCVAAVALLVAALGIANTMLMSVLERTREIGIMKAVGASNRQLQFVFLVEGALVGMFGGGIGLFLAWAASFPGDAWVRSIVSRDLKITLKQPIFVFPPWVILTVIAFAIIVTTLAAVYPARRAARVDPIAALRHE
jgi:putative ABC transport system permease protein